MPHTVVCLRNGLRYHCDVTFETWQAQLETLRGKDIGRVMVEIESARNDYATEPEDTFRALVNLEAIDTVEFYQ